LQASRNSREANRYLMRRLGWDLSFDFNEQYFAEALYYHLGLLNAYTGQPEQMAHYISRSQTMPSQDDDQLFSDHVNLSHVIRAHQEMAIKKGMPSILIACMPRSASATLTHTVAHLLDIPVIHLSIGRFPHHYLAPS